MKSKKKKKTTAKESQRKPSMHTYQSPRTHARVVPKTSDRCWFLPGLLFEPFRGRLGVRSEPAGPRSGLTLSGGACPELSRADGAQVEHAARGGASQNASAVGGWGRVEAALSPPPPRLMVVLGSPVCIKYPYLSALTDYEENISIFCNCSLTCHNSCFLAHC